MGRRGFLFACHRTAPFLNPPFRTQQWSASPRTLSASAGAAGRREAWLGKNPLPGAPPYGRHSRGRTARFSVNEGSHQVQEWRPAPKCPVLLALPSALHSSPPPHQSWSPDLPPPNPQTKRGHIEGRPATFPFNFSIGKSQNQDSHDRTVS